MASGVTNRGKFMLLGWAFVDLTIPTNFYMGLADDTTAPDVDDNAWVDLTQVPDTQGYTDGGYSLSPGATDWDVHTEDDGGDKGLVQIKDVVWTASGGTLPASGDGARWAVLTDDDGTMADREIYIWWDLVSNRQVSDGQTLTLQDCEVDIT